MRIEHVAVWTKNLETLKAFYMEFFGGTPNNKYRNPRTGFESYFLTFGSGARLELMDMPSVAVNSNDPEKAYTGYVHLAFSVGSRDEVDALTEKLRGRGYQIVSQARQTGDGYYESCVLDPDGNRVEITT
jgi:lactoylglutathione lyase